MTTSTKRSTRPDLTAAARSALGDPRLTAAQAVRIFVHRPGHGPHMGTWGTCGNALECRGITTPHPDPFVRYELTGLGFECQRLMHEIANEKWDREGVPMHMRALTEDEALSFARQAAQVSAQKQETSSRAELPAALAEFHAAIANLEKARPSEYRREGARLFGVDARNASEHDET